MLRLAWVAKAHVAERQRRLARRINARLLEGNVSGLLDHVADATGGGDDLAQVLERATDRRQRFKGRQRAEDKQRNQRAGRAVAADAAGGHPQNENDRHAAYQRHHRL